MTIVIEVAALALLCASGIYAIARAVAGHHAALIHHPPTAKPDPDANPVYEWDDADWAESRDRRAS